MMAAAVFDALAPEYDARFTESVLGQRLRRALWRWLDDAFARGQRVLELNCGTGEDAIHLAARGVRVLATDTSPAMLDVARGKVGGAGLSGLVDVRLTAIERLEELRPEAGVGWDGAFSSFGGLNCVADVARVARALGTLLERGARVVLCVMGPVVPWEWVWFLVHRQPGRAFRRLAAGGVQWRGITVRYPSVRAVSRAFAPDFAVRRTGGLGVLVPPTYAEAWARRHPLLVERLDRWERRLERWPLAPWLGDHYLLELERR